jgi:murein DD-endopeptidase MepM/ murein hydrolase activator NlpD
VSQAGQDPNFNQESKLIKAAKTAGKKITSKLVSISAVRWGMLILVFLMLLVIILSPAAWGIADESSPMNDILFPKQSASSYSGGITVAQIVAQGWDDAKWEEYILPLAIVEAHKANALPSQFFVQAKAEASMPRPSQTSLAYKGNNFYGHHHYPNMFEGFKTKYGGTFTPKSGSHMTWEEDRAGNETWGYADFNHYNTVENCIQFHGWWMQMDRYAPLREASKDPANGPNIGDVLYRIGYATDNAYGSNYRRIYNQYDYGKYDDSETYTLEWAQSILASRNRSRNRSGVEAAIQVAEGMLDMPYDSDHSPDPPKGAVFTRDNLYQYKVDCSGFVLHAYCVETNTFTIPDNALSSAKPGFDSKGQEYRKIETYDGSMKPRLLAQNIYDNCELKAQNGGIDINQIQRGDLLFTQSSSNPYIGHIVIVLSTNPNGTVEVIHSAGGGTTMLPTPSGERAFLTGVTYGTYDVMNWSATHGGRSIYWGRLAYNETSMGEDSFAPPVDNVYFNNVTSEYGPRNLAGTGPFHYGIDFGFGNGNVGQPIYASMSGEVIEAGWHNSYGNHIKLKHEYQGQEAYTIYAHCSRLDVSAGDYVMQGDLIAGGGNTGNSFGEHLHFEILIGGLWTENNVNPRHYLTW